MAAFFYFSCMEKIKEIFQKYESLVFSDGFQSEYEEFYEGGISKEILVDGKTQKQYAYLSDEGQALNLDDYMKMRAHEYAQLLYSKSENYLNQVPKEEIQKFNYVFNFYYRRYSDWLSSQKELKFSSIFYHKLSDIKSDIDLLFKLHFKIHGLKYEEVTTIDDFNNDQNSSSVFQSNPKIKWLAKTNVLTTLFYDLMNGQDRNAPLIETTKKDIIDLIVNNFVDSDGSQFSKQTIETYLRDSTPEKKAKRGDRIELGNVKQKNRL